MNSDDEIDAIVRTTLQTKILAAIKSAPEAIDAMVQSALEKPVDALTGRTDGYRDSKVPYLEYLVGQTIRDAARGAVQKVIVDMTPTIEDAVRKRMATDDLARSMVKAFTDATALDWKVNVTIEKEEIRR